MSDQLNTQIKYLSAQLRAHQFLYNECLASSIQHRVDLIIAQGDLQKANQELATSKKENEDMLAKVATLESELAMLKNPPAIAE